MRLFQRDHRPSLRFTPRADGLEDRFLLSDVSGIAIGGAVGNGNFNHSGGLANRSGGVANGSFNHSGGVGNNNHGSFNT